MTESDWFIRIFLRWINTLLDGVFLYSIYWHKSSGKKYWIKVGPSLWRTRRSLGPTSDQKQNRKFKSGSDLAIDLMRCSPQANHNFNNNNNSSSIWFRIPIGIALIRRSDWFEGVLNERIRTGSMMTQMCTITSLWFGRSINVSNKHCLSLSLSLASNWLKSLDCQCFRTRLWTCALNAVAHKFYSPEIIDLCKCRSFFFFLNWIVFIFFVSVHIRFIRFLFLSKFDSNPCRHSSNLEFVVLTSVTRDLCVYVSANGVPLQSR